MTKNFAAAILTTLFVGSFILIGYAFSPAIAVSVFLGMMGTAAVYTVIRFIIE